MNLDSRFLSKVSFIEGVSLLLLLFVAMPLKYGLGLALAVKIVGTAHGVLFMLLVALIAWVAKRDAWPKELTGIALVSSSLPLGMFVLERKLKIFYAQETA
jgi:integral membrane protein